MKMLKKHLTQSDYLLDVNLCMGDCRHMTTYYYTVIDAR